jgi:hypothetical protein
LTKAPSGRAVATAAEAYAEEEEEGGRRLRRSLTEQRTVVNRLGEDGVRLSGELAEGKAELTKSTVELKAMEGSVERCYGRAAKLRRLNEVLKGSAAEVGGRVRAAAEAEAEAAA